MDIPESNPFTLRGELSVELVKGTVTQPCCCYVIMGSTGVGKSTFIEACAGKGQRLSISMNQLEGYTQSVSAYKLKNAFVRRGSRYDPVYLIDTPGLSDTRMSEFEIIDMIRSWLAKNELRQVEGVLLLFPITEIRMPGSRRRTITMLLSLFGSTDTATITILTTMWDTLYGERAQKRAESNLVQLREDVLKDFVTGGSQMLKFTNTRQSAIDILSEIRPLSIKVFADSDNATLNSYLFQDILERLQVGLHRKRAMKMEITGWESRTNASVKNILQQNLQENDETLTKFITQLVQMGPPPVGHEYAAQRLRKQIVADILPMDSHHKNLFLVWAHEVDIPENFDDPTNPQYLESMKLCYSGPSIPDPAFSALLRRLIDLAKHRDSKWFKSRG